MDEFVDEFGFAVADFFDDDWDAEELGDHVSEAVDFICFALGIVDDEDEGYDEEPGFLSRFERYSVSELTQNEGFLNWFNDNLEAVAGFLDDFGVLSESLTETFEAVVERVDTAAKFVPLVGSLKGLLDSGCDLHSSLDAGREPDLDAYIEFFKNVALVAVEVVLLATGLGASYRVAYGTTGWVNRQLINVVGRSVGWRAYSWVLSQIHWGIRVAFSEASGLAINEAVSEATRAVVTAAAGQDQHLSRREVEGWVREDVEEIALSEGDGPEVWEYRLEAYVDDLMPEKPDLPFA